MSPNKDIDLSLSVLSVITPRGHSWSLRELADVCGCSMQYIQNTERAALKKLRHPAVIKLLLE